MATLRLAATIALRSFDYSLARQTLWANARLRAGSGLDIAFVMACPATALERIDHPVPRYLSIRRRTQATQDNGVRSCYGRSGRRFIWCAGNVATSAKVHRSSVRHDGRRD
jgi:hypothetical protein